MPSTALPIFTTTSGSIGGRQPRHPRRRAALVTAVALGLVTALAACSTSSEAASTASTGSGTRVVETAKGKVTIPTHPLRVVSIQSYTTESLLDLGVTPVGVENPGEEYVPQRYLARWKKIPKVVTGASVDLEKIAALKPDLIVGVDVPFLDKEYAKLTQIAPTALATFTDDWTTYPKATADFTNRDSSLTALQTKYENRIRADKKKYASVLKTTSFDVIQGGFDTGNYWIYSEQSAVGRVLAQLGGHFASATKTVKAGDTSSVSYEKADLLSDADAIVYYENNDGTPANNIQNLFDLQTFTDLNASKNGLVIGTPDFLPGSYSDATGILTSVEKALDAKS
ncbi:MAG: transporter substrate-binding protein [Frondihabitans sp.]|nr:transporter substrate-binding protein [Frondihabitans sp.]